MANFVKGVVASIYADWQKSTNKPFTIIAVMCVIVALAEASGHIGGDGTKIGLLLGLAIITLLAPKLETLSFGSDGIKAALIKLDANNIAATSEVDSNINVKLDQLFREIASLKEMLAGMGGAPAEAAFLSQFVELPPPMLANDPNKGRFGGSEKQNGRILCATVEESTLSGGWCKLTLIVQATTGAPPVTGKVAFFLHDSFSPDRYVLNAERGEAVGALLRGLHRRGHRRGIHFAGARPCRQPQCRGAARVAPALTRMSAYSAAARPCPSRRPIASTSSSAASAITVPGG